MKYLKPYTGKKCEVVIQSRKQTYTLKGFIWRYMSDESVYYAKPRYEYYIGYDGGMMTLVKPREVVSIKEIKHDGQ